MKMPSGKISRVQVGGPGMSVIDTLDGPKFGVDGLHILLQEGRERIAQSRLGT